MVCEPSEVCRANAELVLLSESTSTAMPEYPLVQRENTVAIELKHDIEVGTEISCIYGLSRRCYKNRSYVPGFAWDEALPKRARAPTKSVSTRRRSKLQMDHSLSNLTLIHAQKHLISK